MTARGDGVALGENSGKAPSTGCELKVFKMCCVICIDAMDSIIKAGFSVTGPGAPRKLGIVRRPFPAECSSHSTSSLVPFLD